MTRRWHNEDWRKLYTRQDGPWLALPAVARAFASDLLKYADGDGTVIRLRAGEKPEAEIASLVGAKARERKIVGEAIRDLLDEGYLVHEGAEVRIKNFGEAQQRRSPDALRKARQREREEQARRDMKRDDGADMSRDDDRDSERDMSRDIPRETRRDETRRDEDPPTPQGAHGVGDAPDLSDRESHRALVEHCRSLVGTKTRAGTAAPPGDLVAAVAAVAEREVAPDGDRAAFAGVFCDGFDRLRAGYPPSKKPTWRADGIERHAGTVLRMLAGAEPWPETWTAAASAGRPPPVPPPKARALAPGEVPE